MFISIFSLHHLIKRNWHCVTTLILSLTCQVAFGWGFLGHQTVAIIAEQNLSPAAKQEVDRLLALESGQTLSSISIWADEHRSRSTGSWHYVNFPRNTCEYEELRDCPNGNCVVAVIKKQLQILELNTSDENRLKALKYLVHFVGDIHQPLHAGYKDDKGGNNYPGITKYQTGD